MAREYWMDRDGMNMPPKKTAVTVVSKKTETATFFGPFIAPRFADFCCRILYGEDND